MEGHLAAEHWPRILLPMKQVAESEIHSENSIVQAMEVRFREVCVPLTHSAAGFECLLLIFLLMFNHTETAVKESSKQASAK